MSNEILKFIGTVTVEVFRADGTYELICKDKPNLLTTAGRDWIHSQVYNTGTTNQAKYIGLSTDAGAPAVGDTTLTGEIVANGLQRAAGTVAHSNGTTTTTVSNTFTATTTFTAVQKTALFSQASGGTLVHENTITSTNLASGDNIVVTWTITAS